MVLPIVTLSLLSTLAVAAVDEPKRPSPSPTRAIATILPENTPFFVFFNTKAEAWGTLRRFQLFQTAFTTVSQFLQPDLKLDYAEDVESWLGDQVGFAFMPKAGSATASIDSSFLMLAPVKDDTRLQPFLDKLKADTQRVTPQQYKGITILEIKANVPALPPSKPRPFPQKFNQSTPIDPSSVFKLPKPNLGIRQRGLAVETSNRTAADITLKKLDQFVKSFSMGAVAINTHNLNGQPVTSWELGGDSSQSLLAYSWVDNNTIIVTTGFGAIADLVPQPYVLLPSTYNFTTATSSLPRPNQGYFYMNMESFLLWVYGFVPPTFNDQNLHSFKQIIGTIHSISATTSTTAKRDQFDILVALAPVRKQLKPIPVFVPN